MIASCLSPLKMLSGYAGWLAAILIVASAATVSAQSPTVAIGGGYERGEISIEFLEKGGRSSNDAFINGMNQAVEFAELAFPVHGNGVLTVAVRLSGYHADVVLLAPLPEIQVLIPAGPEPNVDGIDEEISFSMQSLQIEFLGKVAIVEGLRLGVGPVLGYRVIQDYRHSYLYEIPVTWTPPFSHLEEKGHRVVYGSETDMQDNHLAIGVLFTAEYDLPLTQQLSLVPEIRLRGESTSPFPDSRWNIVSAGGALSVRYSL
jgi:hypothetical protein